MEQVNKYANGKIYKLTNDITDLVYYGSTTKTLNKRLSWHKSDYKKYINGNRHYTTSFKLFESNGTVNIELVENVNCNSRKELEKREKYYILSNECLNKNVPTRTQKEYYENNKDHISDRMKKYREKNIDVCRKKDKIYYEENKDKKKLYRLNNIDKFKEYYQKNKEKFSEDRSQAFVCECGRSVRKGDIARHKKTQIHLKLILELKKIN